ncbi:hypothetical protein DFP73DRAFT_596255 [Morchella snyderi]|nr:hypothetical protein DFP73DRAFT_596255 [Morchella snyderi]
MGSRYLWYIFLFLVIQLPNYIGIAVWQHFYTKTTVYPAWNPSRSTNTRTDMRGEFAGILIFSALSGISHFCAGIKILLILLVGARDQRSKFTLVLCLVGGVTFTLFASSVMFVAPFVAPEWSWKRTYKNTCEGMDLWAHLEAPGVRQAREVIFEDWRAATNFTMVMSPDPVAADFDSKGLYTFNVTSNGTGTPEWTSIEYNPWLSRYTIYGGKSSSYGTFKTGKQFRIPNMHLRGDLGLFETRCVFDPTVQIGDAREREGDVLIKTAQFKICGELVVCADSKLGDVAVPVGLLMLSRAKRGGECCNSRHRIPGVEGRDYQ